VPGLGTRRADQENPTPAALSGGSFAATTSLSVSQQADMAASAANDAAMDDAAPVAGLPDEVGGRTKRLMDITLATVALVLMAPVLLMTALIVRIAMGSPVIFAHQRVGRNGATFKCYKFRTMVCDAEEVLHRHLEADAAAADEWISARKLHDDPRVTRLGRVLRKSSLDELPQLLNVLRGEMSCVGPRPIVPEELERYGPYAVAYLSVRPGLTGAWQVSGRSSLSYEARVALDYGYVRVWSLWRDVAIIIRTIPAVMSHDGAA